MNPCTVDWGDVATWVSGIATLVAVAVALVFSVRGERRQRAIEVSQVHAWVQQHSDPSDPRWKLIVSNKTDYPITRWLVLISWDADGVGHTDTVDHEEMGIIPPGVQSFDWKSPDDPPTTDSRLSVTISFKDGDGRTRRRLPDGALKSVPRSERAALQ